MPARRKAGTLESAARRDLRSLPPAYRNSAIAQTYLLMARRLDAGVNARDTATLARELRLALLVLYDLSPPAREDDAVDELRKRREERMAGLARNTQEGR